MVRGEGVKGAKGGQRGSEGGKGSEGSEGGQIERRGEGSKGVSTLGFRVPTTSVGGEG